MLIPRTVIFFRSISVEGGVRKSALPNKQVTDLKRSSHHTKGSVSDTGGTGKANKSAAGGGKKRLQNRRLSVQDDESTQSDDSSETVETLKSGGNRRTAAAAGAAASRGRRPGGGGGSRQPPSVMTRSQSARLTPPDQRGGGRMSASAYAPDKYSSDREGSGPRRGRPISAPKERPRANSTVNSASATAAAKKNNQGI